MLTVKDLEDFVIGYGYIVYNIISKEKNDYKVLREVIDNDKTNRVYSFNPVCPIGMMYGFKLKKEHDKAMKWR